MQVISVEEINRVWWLTKMKQIIAKLQASYSLCLFLNVKGSGKVWWRSKYKGLQD